MVSRSSGARGSSRLLRIEISFFDCQLELDDRQRIRNWTEIRSRLCSQAERLRRVAVELSPAPEPEQCAAIMFPLVVGPVERARPPFPIPMVLPRVTRLPFPSILHVSTVDLPFAPEPPPGAWPQEQPEGASFDRWPPP
jgi:hypothetical protein